MAQAFKIWNNRIRQDIIPVGENKKSGEVHRLFDVGSQRNERRKWIHLRNERRKWIHLFEGVSADQNMSLKDSTETKTGCRREGRMVNWSNLVWIVHGRKTTLKLSLELLHFCPSNDPNKVEEETTLDIVRSKVLDPIPS
ncbi:hypothetical protein JHK87_011896 [Glycine soja]|nr:hypothetical protein JHK87_011896 [Glycine soja]